MLQRPSTMASTSANVTSCSGGTAARSPCDGPPALSSTIAAMPAAATPQVHQGFGSPLWRTL